jgi:acyl carrier protein phosphodiesterase
MNFLAHLFLSFKNEDIIIGNFIADSIRNSEVKNYPKAVQKGIYLHREIDSFTDNHPAVRKGTLRLQPHHHKYAPVVIDILFDYILANNWDRYSDQSLESFARFIYSVLNKRIEEIPEKLKKNVPGMIKNNWLQSYKTKEGLLYTLKRMDNRASFPSKFTQAVEDMEQDYNLFENEFNIFFPELINHVNSQNEIPTPQSAKKP